MYVRVCAFVNRLEKLKWMVKPRRYVIAITAVESIAITMTTGHEYKDRARAIDVADMLMIGHKKYRVSSITENFASQVIKSKCECFHKHFI